MKHFIFILRPLSSASITLPSVVKKTAKLHTKPYISRPFYEKQTKLQETTKMSGKGNY